MISLSYVTHSPTHTQTHTSINTHTGLQKQQMARGLFPLYPHPPSLQTAAEALLMSLSFQHSVQVCSLTCPVPMPLTCGIWRPTKRFQILPYMNQRQAFLKKKKKIAQVQVFMLTCLNDGASESHAAVPTQPSTCMYCVISFNAVISQ